ncbi:ribose-5-phosphate isomerase RpiA [Holzapfeliella sp. He02]|uniref:Ribose-5-phosphate isomerase A n=1 Tax=Holzapfeliella saturejae TaxID=3082953 RepID=A0ABU8SFH4_9LACO
MDQNTLKKSAAEYACANFIHDNMKLGLGTGSTVTFLVDALGKRIKEENLTITTVSTSSRTKRQAESLGIKVVDLNDVDELDLTIDGADQISSDYQGIKGGGAAHTLEKIVATASKRNLWIVDDSKLAEPFGSFPLPVEVLKTALHQLLLKFEAKNLNPKLRLDENGEPVKTHFGNLIVDLHLGEIKQPHELGQYLKSQVGVVEHGLFLDTVNTVIVGREAGPECIDTIR